MPDRINDFKRFWVHQLLIHDCDPGVYALKYLVRRMELNEHQKFWICWLYASTYNIATTWVLFNEFPDYENVCVERLAKFNTENIKRLPYQKDQKWLRGHLASMYTYMRYNQCGDDLNRYWRDRQGDFDACWSAAMNLHRVGRYTAWMFLQAMNEVCELQIQPTSLELNHDSSAMHRGGLCLALGKDEWAAKGYKFNAAELNWLDEQAAIITTEVQDAFPEFRVVHADYFSMETSLCAYRKLFRRERGRYLGYYLDRWAEDIIKVTECGWPGINWNLLWECRTEGLPALFDRHTGVDKTQFGIYLDSGEFMPDCPLRNTLNKTYNDRILRS